MVLLPAQDMQKKLQKLAAFQNKNIPVLSLYLQNNQWVTREDLKRVITSFLTTEEYDLFSEEIQIIKTYIDNNQFSGIVFFISDQLFETIEYNFAIPSQCFVGHKPYILLLEKAMTGYDVTIVIGNKKIILAFLYKGRIENYKEFSLTKIKKNRISQKINEEIKKILQDKKINEVFVGGENSFTKKIIPKFPKELKRKIKGIFLNPNKISEHIIIEHMLHTIGILEEEFPQNSME